MKGNLKIKDVVSIYETIKMKLRESFEREEYESTCRQIELAAHWAYFYNFIFSDKELDDYLYQIAAKKGIKSINNNNPGSIAFVCSRMADNCELVQQYVRAIKASGRKTLMIVIDRKMALGYKNILKDIESAKNISLQFVSDDLPYEVTADIIANLVLEFQPEIILQHIIPWDVKMLLGILCVKGAKRFNVNFNDHTFWLGSSFLDYNIEFRPYGEIISVKDRNICANQLRRLLYYPISDKEKEFQGFPFEKGDKIVIFTGGNYYKMCDKEKTFFKIIDRILDENENAVVLIAGAQKATEKEINKLKNVRRIYLTPFRRDIFQLFAHIDVFLCTYPIGGALMTQYAAIQGKPIMSYEPINSLINDACGVLHENNNINISFNNVDNLCNYAHLLCHDSNFRKEEGKKAKTIAQTQEKFEKEFLDLFEEEDHYKIQEIEIEKDKISQFYIDINNKYIEKPLAYLLNEYGWDTLRFFPPIRILVAIMIVKKRIRTIFS